MSESSPQSKKLQWAWVGITFVMYMICYVLPILVVGGVFGNFVVSYKAGIFIGAWLFGGAVILPAIAGYISKGITILEPAIAGSPKVAKRRPKASRRRIGRSLVSRLPRLHCSVQRSKCFRRYSFSCRNYGNHFCSFFVGRMVG